MDTTPVFLERRKGIRRPCSYYVEGWLGQQSFDATVRDMSGGGLLFTCSDDIVLQRGAKVELIHTDPAMNAELNAVEFIVLWTRVKPSENLRYVGVTFADRSLIAKSWFKVMMKTVGFRGHNLREQRKFCRVNCEMPAALVLTSQELPSTVVNLGLGGLRIECQKPIQVGAQIAVRMEHPSLSQWKVEAMVRRLEHPSPDSPFVHALLFRGLTEEQNEAIQDYMVEQRKSLWESAAAEVEDELEEELDETSEGEDLSEEHFEQEKAAILREIQEQERLEAEERQKAEEAARAQVEQEEEESVDEEDAFVPKYRTAEEALAALERGEIEIPGSETSQEEGKKEAAGASDESV